MGSRVGYRGAYSAVRQLFAVQELRAFGVRIPLPADEGSPGPDGEPTDRVMLLETENYLPNQLLRDTDQMSMAHSIEVRVPLLDDSVVRVALALPASVRTAAGKRMLVAAAGGPQVTKRPFSLPFDVWLRGPLRRAGDMGPAVRGLPFAGEVPPGFRRHYGGTWKKVEPTGAVPGPWRFCGSGREPTTSVGECVRVLITVPNLDRSFGGPAVKVGQLASALAASGWMSA